MKPRPSRTALALLFAGLLLGAIALGARVRGQPGLPIDLSITRAVQRETPVVLAYPLGVLSTLGFAPLVDGIDAVIVALIFVRGRRREAVAAALAGASGAVANHVAKLLVPRPRPPSGAVHVAHHIANSSFPAGHVLNFTVFGGFLCYLAWTRLEPGILRAVVVALLVALELAMGLSRVYVGEHWPSDVLGGYLIGGALLVLAMGLFERYGTTQYGRIWST